MSEITIKIDGKECKTKEGEFILNVARANDIFIPAICYLTRCSPTLACRLCLVEADGKQVYACNAKAKDGMEITTLTDNIAKERRAIMGVYDVNHPLQCGVCDQSGECELQNYTLEMGVDEQHYAIKDIQRESKEWGLIHYDPGLCIVCERCVTVCKDMIGDAALKTVPRGGEALDKELKNSMPKDAYAMWNKLNKSLIGPATGETLECTDCGECIAVCPVGALVSSDFQYTSNAWELTSIPAACAHCSAGCHLYYDVKHTSIDNPEPKIYRVKNEWNYVSLCGAGRFGYDFENRVEGKDEKAFDRALEAFKKADTIRFGSAITNEEALILQHLKTKHGYRLVNEDARRFQKFMAAYGSVTGTNLWNGDLDAVHRSDFVVSIGSQLKSDNPRARFAFNNAIKMNKGAGLYFHPIKDPVVEGFGKNLMAINHKPGLEEAALYLILDLFGDRESLPKDVVKYLDSFHKKGKKTIEETVKEKVVEKVTKKVKDEETGEEKEVIEEVTKMVPKKVKKEVEADINTLLGILDAPEDFDDRMAKMLAKKESFSIILGEDLINHPKAENLAKLAGMIEKYTDFKVVVLPSRTNTLGVSLICDLDEEPGEYVIGYNAAGDFILSASGRGDLDMPALNQQEGTFTNVDKRVVPTYVALPYKGYVLNDIANALGLRAGLTVDYTAALPEAKGFRPLKFDDLPNHYTNKGEEIRGYHLDVKKVEKAKKIAAGKIDRKGALKGEIAYRCNPVLQFNEFTQRAHEIATDAKLQLSPEKMESLGLKEGERVRITLPEGSVELAVTSDKFIGGEIVMVPDFDPAIETERLFSANRYQNVTIEKV
ncbi:NADH-quinone oxidoreductase subunit G [Hydrogenimonas urashimensis]|uniref:NADH-quinone oxidoreductase subunit G n=1 Tax=Hydrogenimonas urashimensis TaxID=2740515 RepID=UPI00191661BE|nr:NADH-quinone oxidoreductase subunit G [Hydrogenimonas urashimensis]